MSLTWNSCARLPSRRTSSADRSSACATLVAPSAVPRPRVDQYRSSWKTTLRGSVCASSVSYAETSANWRSNSQLWLWTISVWAGLAGPLAQRVQVLGVGHPLGLRGVVRRRAGAEVLDAEDLVLREDPVEVRGRGGRADVDVARRGLDAVLVEQRAHLRRRQAAQREQLDVPVARVAQEGEHLLEPRLRRGVGAEAAAKARRMRADMTLFSFTLGGRPSRPRRGEKSTHLCSLHKQKSENRL